MEYEVGKPKFKFAVFYSIGWLTFFVWFIIIIVIADESIMRYFTTSILLLIIFCTIFISIPGISYSQLMWKVNSEYLKYTYHGTMYDKIVSFFVHILRTHKVEYQISIKMKEIDYIDVRYAKLPKPPYGAFGYDIMFHVYTYDGSIFSFQSLVTKDRSSFNEAVDFMKREGICFKDQYNILNELKKDRPIAYYLEEMEKNIND